ncbi:hypothetical protein O6V14_04765 [Sphingomonas faeni]|uniref:hypothetical protein n=1 Tax=Sphingomonas faeni TaxID=185950 RepID=UPI003344B6FB
MIYQHPSATSIRDREIAAMPIAIEYKGEPAWISLCLWLAIALCAAMFLVALA